MSLENKFQNGWEGKGRQGQRLAFHFNPVKAIPGAVFIFPGQSSPFPGMFREELEKFPLMQSYFDRADKQALACGLPEISLYVRSPETLNASEQAAVKILALFTVEVALARIVADLGVSPHAVSGHSVGEYAALVVSGILRFEEAVRVLIFREAISPPFNEAGYLLAVQAGRDRLAPLLFGETEIFLSNENSKSQSVISLTWRQVARFERKLAELGLKYKRLSVGQPYHCPLLTETVLEMESFLEREPLEIQPPRIPLFSSVLKAWVQRSDFSVDKVLRIISRQMVEPVDFILQCEKLAAYGPFVEVGPKQVCQTFLKENLGNPDIRRLSDILKNDKSDDTARRTKRPVSQEALGFVQKIIALVTGYQIESIRVEDRLQEDLGLDSLKLTEVMVSVMEGLKQDPNLRSGTTLPSTVGEIAHEVERVRVKTPELVTQDQMAMIRRQFYSPQTHAYLSDHRIKGRMYFPAAMGVDGFADSARGLLKGSILIKDFVIAGPIIVGEKGTELSLKIKPDPDGFYTMQLGASQGAPAFSARVESAELVAGTRPFSPGKQPAFVYAGSGLTHGPAFQMLESLVYGVTEASGKVRRRKPSELKSVWLDAIFQTVGWAGIQRWGKATILPVRIGEIYLLKSADFLGDNEVFVSALEREGDILSADAEYYENGSLVSVWRGMKMHFVRES